MCEGRIKTDSYAWKNNDEKYIKSKWNVVRIKNAWYLCNPQFACSHGVKYDKAWCLINDDGTLEEMEEKFDEKTEYKTYYHYNDYYFLTNPEELIYTHLPDDPKFQLLARKVTFDEFEQMVCLRQPFFDAGLTIISHPRRIIETSDPKIEIFIGTNSDIPVSFRHQICLLNDIKPDENTEPSRQKKEESNIDLQSYVTLFQDRLRFRGVIRLRLPKSGTYKLAIFLRIENEEVFQRNVYKNACEYEIHFTRKTNDVNIHSFPITAKTELGPNSDMVKYNFSNILPSIGMIDADENGYVEINFDGNDQLYDIVCNLENKQCSTDDLQKSILTTFKNGKAVIRILVAQEGEYALNIYAKKKDKDKEKLNAVCSYIINCKAKPKTVIKFCKDIESENILNKKFIDFGLKIEPNFNCFQTIYDKFIDFKIFKTKSLRFSLKLLLWDSNGAKKLIDDCAFCENQLDYSTISIKFPSIGIYQLTVFSDQTPEGIEPLPIFTCYFLVLEKKEVKRKQGKIFCFFFQTLITDCRIFVGFFLYNHLFFYPGIR